MKSSTLTFPRSARTVYTAVKHVFESSDRFSNVKCDDRSFNIKASHGMSLIPLGENIKVRVVACGPETTNVIVESSSKLFLNFFASNKENVQTLGDYINNAVWRLLDIDGAGHSRICIVQPVIKFSRNHNI